MVKVRKKLMALQEFHLPGKPAVRCTDAQIRYIREFNDRVRQGLVTFEDVDCLCGANIFDLIARVDRYSMLQDTVMCVACGLVQSNPRMTAQGYAQFYGSDLYRLCYEGDDYLKLCEFKYTNKTGAHILDEISKVRDVGPEVAILEFGAGGGWNLLPFMARGAGVLGMDYSQSLVQLGERHRIPMRQGTISDVQGEYDIIILNHVFEHFLDPVESLRLFGRHLKASGIIYLAVPNIMNFGMGQLQNAHVYYFTPYMLERYCAEAGFCCLRSGSSEKIHMFGIFEPCRSGQKIVLKNTRVEISFAGAWIKTLLKRLIR